MVDSSQKFIARNRAPRVQIEYDVELYGATKKVQLPFVMGVLSDLSGKSQTGQPPISDRKFLEIDVDNFDDRMKAMAPRVAFAVPNTLSGEGNLSVDLTFEKMADFSPAAIAAKIEPLKELLAARMQLANLMAYMDGKAGAEALIEKILANPALLASLASGDTTPALQDAALESLRAADIPEEPEKDEQAQALEALRTADVAETVEDTSVSEALASLPEAVEATDDDGSADILSNLTNEAPEAEDRDTSVADALASLPNAEISEEQDDSAKVLEQLSESAPIPEEDTSVADALSSLPDAENVSEDLGSDGILANLAEVPTEVEAEDTSMADALSSLPQREESDNSDNTDEYSDIREGLSSAPAEIEDTSVSDALSSLPEIEEPLDTDSLDGALDSLTRDVSELESEDTSVPDALSSLPEIEPADVEDEFDDIFRDLSDSTTETENEDTFVDDALSSLPDIEDIEARKQPRDILEDLADGGQNAESEEISISDALRSSEKLEDAVPDTEAADILEGLLDDEPEQEDKNTTAADVLSSIPEPEVTSKEDVADDILASLPDLDVDSQDPTAPLDDALPSLPEAGAEPELATELDNLLDDLTGSESTEEPTEETDLDEFLSDLDASDENHSDDFDEQDDLLNDLNLSEDQSEMSAGPELQETTNDLPETAEAEETDTSIDDLLDDFLGTEDEAEEPTADALSDLDDLLDDLDEPDVSDEQSVPETGGEETAAVDIEPDEGSDADDELDDLLADLTDLGDDVDAAKTPPSAQDEEALLHELEAIEDNEEDDIGLSDLLSDLDIAEDEDTSDDLDDLDDLMPDAEEENAGQADTDDDLDALLSALEDDEPADLDKVLAVVGEDDTSGSELDDLLGDLDAEALDDQPSAVSKSTQKGSDPEFAFGTLSADRPEPQKLNRKRFRIALFGDFSGRAARGDLEIGDALAGRKPILLDPDTVEDVIKRFATKLVLPIGKDGAGIEVLLDELDDLHPDELFEKVELFEGLTSLKRQLSSGATAQNAAKQLAAWGEQFGQAIAPPRKSSGGNTVRADRKLSEFQKLIGDTSDQLAQASPLDDLLARIVGPHIRQLPDADTVAMQNAVDEAFSVAMRLVLHHPEFQSLESQWRSLDLIARSVETDDTLEVMLYDIAADEIAADLATEDDLSKAGIVRLLTEDPLDEENGRGGYSALIGLYTFEETPPHAEILARFARVAAHIDAPFFSAVTPAYLDIDAKDRHPLVAQAWDTLRAMPEAGHLGLASPRFLLRRPYGAKSEPIYEFEFEEFTMSEGLRGMLWANPAVLVLILLARSFKQNGPSMGLGQIMSLGGMPYHFVNDRYGDQVALPCTERNLSLAKHEHSVNRGYMPVLSVKGRDEIRLGSFNSVAGKEILGPWTGMPPPEPSPPQPVIPKPQEGESQDQGEPSMNEDDALSDLDDLLAEFADDTTEDTDSDDIDADLAALLDDL